MKDVLPFNFFVKKSPPEITRSSESDSGSLSTGNASSILVARRKVFFKKYCSPLLKIASPLATIGFAIGTGAAYNRYKASEANNPSPPSDGLAYSPSGDNYLLAATLVAGAFTVGFLVINLFLLAHFFATKYKSAQPPPAKDATAC